MSLLEPTTSPASEAGLPLGEDARRPAESPTTWSYLRTLSGVPAPSTGTAPDWADDERLDELFSAWATAALAADVVTDRSFGPSEVPPPVDVVASVPEVEAPTYEPAVNDDVVDAPAGPQALPAWTRYDDEIIPRPRGRGRWGRGRR